jgi:hypothetical protein
MPRGGEATDKDSVLVGNRETRSHPSIGALTAKFPFKVADDLNGYQMQGQTRVSLTCGDRCPR